MSAIVNAKFKPLSMRKMVIYAAFMGLAAFGSVYWVMNYLLD